MLLKKTDFIRILEKESGESEQTCAIPQLRAASVCTLGGRGQQDLHSNASTRSVHGPSKEVHAGLSGYCSGTSLLISGCLTECWGYLKEN